MKRDTSFLKYNFVAHRGLHNKLQNIPENSIKAFKNTIKNNLIIELDVHVLKDNNVVVFHDDNLKRMIGINKKIRDLDYNELENLKLNKTDQKIPLLENALELVNGEVPIIIELKYDVGKFRLEKEVIKILKDYKGKYAIQSFNPLSILYFRMKQPGIVRGLILSNYKNKNISLLKKLFLNFKFLNFVCKPDFISYDIRALPNKKILKYQRNNLVFGWTVKNNLELKKTKKYCDNIIFEGFMPFK